MCGRFFLDAPAGEIIEHYNVPPPSLFTARYNIAPTTPVLARTEEAMTLFRWGLVPSWSKDISMGNRMFNARAETVTQKPSFKQAYRRRRCLIPANGFYEWARSDGRKQPYCCGRKGRIFSMAGIWELWQDADGNELQSCALLTTEASGELARIHHRMPVFINPQDYDGWLDCRSEKTDIADQLVNNTVPEYQIYPVSQSVNNSRNEGPDLILPLS
ncbi:MAG: putative SOS response-associated peptidase YedK [Gammaproteobacteria bacterium]|jgi:putative SOS response-associated peptidase YedK